MNRLKQAVSPVIATLLLIAIAVSASVFLFGFVTSQVQTQGAQAQTQIRLDNIEFSKKDGNLVYTNITVRNSGSVDTKIQVVYITLPDASTVRKEMTSGNVISPGSTLIFTFFFNSTTNVVGGGQGGFTSPTDSPQGTYFNTNTGLTWQTSTSYKIRIVTDNGFFAEGSYSSPIQ